jgi:hypothetical protein
MLRCRDIVLHGEAYLAGDMQGWQRVGFWLHLLFCRYCRRYVRQLKTTRSVSTAMPGVPPAAEDEVDAVLARLAAAETSANEKGGQ